MNCVTMMQMWFSFRKRTSWKGLLPACPNLSLTNGTMQYLLLQGRGGVTIAFKKSCPLVLTSVQTDLEGRFLFVKGTSKHSQCYMLASIYAPNVGTVNFLAKTLKMLEKFREGCLILGSDFNFILDPNLDTSTGKTSLPFRALKYVKQLLRSQHLADSWRVTHTGVKYYTYYSKTHSTHSRLHLFLVDQFYLEKVRNCTIKSIIISYHAPITLTLSG